MKLSLTICVCGAGTMGSGIAQVFAQKGFDVILYDVNEEVLDSARKKIDKYAPGASSAIRFESSIENCKAGLIIEAIVENTEAKTNLINKLFDLNTETTIIATNTSSLSVTDLSKKINRPEQFAGMHFLIPRR